MSVARISAVILRHGYELRRNPNNLTNIIYWPIVTIAVWGFFTLYLAHGNYLGPNLLNTLLGGAILWGLFNGFQRDMAIGFLEEFWAHNVINLFGSPLTITEYLTGLIIINILKTALSVVVMSVVAATFYHYDIVPNLIGLAPFMFILGVASISLGIFVSALILRYTLKLQSLAWSIAGVLMPVSCVFYPMRVLGQPLRTVAWLLPTSHAFEGMRTVLLSSRLPWSDVFWGFGLDGLFLLLATLCFQKFFGAAKKRGLLVKTG